MKKKKKRELQNTKKSKFKVFSKNYISNNFIFCLINPHLLFSECHAIYFSYSYKYYDYFKFNHNYRLNN